MKFLVFLFIIFIFKNSVASEIEIVACKKMNNFPNSTYLFFKENLSEIIFQKNASDIIYPASLTKLMTLYLVFEEIEKNKIKLDSILTVSEYGEEIANVNKINTLHLKAGDKIMVHEAIKAVIVKSFNEAALTLAEAVAGSEWEFAKKMNQKAKELGMINSSFRNATGLHEEGQYTSAYDLARLTIAIKKDFPQFYHFFALKDFKFSSNQYKTHNNFLLNYQGAEGIKTGFTSASGYNLISAAKKHKNRFFSIVTGCETYQERDRLTEQLFDISDN
jgi:D-alanyl-D-alanine carboxypeptidase